MRLPPTASITATLPSTSGICVGRRGPAQAHRRCDGCGAVAALSPDHFDVRLLLHQPQDAPASDKLVIDDERAKLVRRCAGVVIRRSAALFGIAHLEAVAVRVKQPRTRPAGIHRAVRSIVAARSATRHRTHGCRLSPCRSALISTRPGAGARGESMTQRIPTSGLQHPGRAPGRRASGSRIHGRRAPRRSGAVPISDGFRSPDRA